MCYHEFSKDLIQKYISYFKKKYKKEISVEEANNHLSSLANLCLVFYENGDDFINK